MIPSSPKGATLSRAALYIVATPIGNLDDISARALRILKEVDLVAAEDSRHTGLLFKHFGLPKKPFVSYWDQVEEEKADKLVDRMLKEDLTVALVSDAGTPCIADPGYRLVARAKEAGIPVHPIPGPSALTALVSASGLPSDRVLFVGFLPVKDKALREEITSWRATRAAIVFYEAPRRLTKTLQCIAELYPAARLVIGREMTKLHEEIVALSISEALDWATSHEAMKGEAAVMVWPGKEEEVGVDREAIIKEARRAFKEGVTLKTLLQRFATSGMKRQELYQLLLDAKEE